MTTVASGLSDPARDLRDAVIAVFRRVFWGGRRELNPQPSEPQSDALPIELLPPQIEHYKPNPFTRKLVRQNGRFEVHLHD
jgi:hypothetical protein